MAVGHAYFTGLAEPYYYWAVLLSKYHSWFSTRITTWEVDESRIENKVECRSCAGGMSFVHRSCWAFILARAKWIVGFSTGFYPPPRNANATQETALSYIHTKRAYSFLSLFTLSLFSPYLSFLLPLSAIPSFIFATQYNRGDREIELYHFEVRASCG